MDQNLKLLDQQLRALESQYIRQEAHAANVLSQTSEHAHTNNPPQAQQQPPSPRSHLPLQTMLLNAPVHSQPSILFHSNPKQQCSPNLSNLSLSIPANSTTDGARLHGAGGLEQGPPAVPRSTWEAQRAEALLDLQHQLEQMEHTIQLRALAQPKGALQMQAESNLDASSPAMQGSCKENLSPASMGVQNTLRPSTLDHPSKFYPAQQLSDMSSSHPPLQIAQPKLLQLTPPWEVGGVCGPWEYRKGMALLALEEERNALAKQLEAYSRVDRVHADKMQQVHAQHAEAMKDASGRAGGKLERLHESAAHAYATRCLAKRLARALAWWQFETIRTRRLVWAERMWDLRTMEAVFLAWMQIILEARQWPATQKAAQDLVRMDQHALLRQIVTTWSAQAKASARLRRLLQRGTSRRTQRLLLSWLACAVRWRVKRCMLLKAEARYRRSLGRRTLTAFATQVGWELEALRQLMAMNRVRRLRLVLSAWLACCALSQQVARTACRGRLCCALAQWFRVTQAAAAAVQQAELKAQTWIRRQKVDTLHAWHSTTVLRAHRRCVEDKVAAGVRTRQLLTTLSHWHQEVRVSTWAAMRVQRQLRGVLLVWDAWGKRKRRLQRLAACAAARHLQSLLSTTLGAWRVLGAWRKARLLGVDLARMQASIASMQSEITSAHGQAHMQLSRARASACELQLLREEATRVSGLLCVSPYHSNASFHAQPFCPNPPQYVHHSPPSQQPPTPSVSECSRHLPLPLTPGAPLAAATGTQAAAAESGGMGLREGGLVVAPLSWHALPPDPDHPRPGSWRCELARGRHAALWLPGVQGVAWEQQMAREQEPSSMSGGRLNTLQDRVDNTLEGHEAERECSDGSKVEGPFAHRAGGVPKEQLDLIDGLVRPWDAGSPVPALSGVVLVFGGVSGEVWLADLQAVAITRTECLSTKVSCSPVALDTRLLPQAQLTAVRDCACCACGPSSFVAIGGFDGQQETMDMLVFKVSHVQGSTQSLSATVEKLEPRSMCSPIGRSHHTATYHAPSRSILVFGGYSSAAGGHLNDLWVFNMDLMEWIQPDITGDWPPARRGHAAAIGCDTLYIHGGFNGKDHWGDVWCLDLNSWHWEHMVTQGVAPAPCRGHAAVMLEQRHLVVHGGFNGGRHCGQVHVLDTHMGRWSRLQVGGKPDDVPAPRAMHTLTAVGSFCLMVGGCGPLGPLAGVHLLESPPAVAGIAQQQRLVGLAHRLSQATTECAQLHAKLAFVEHEAAQGREQLQAVHARSADLVASHNAVCKDATALRASLVQERSKTAEALAAAREAQFSVAAAERRLQRARTGGHEVASAAEGLHCDLEDARTHMASLQSHLRSLQAQRDAAQTSANQVTAERTVLQTQLAAANNEVTLLRSLMGSMGSVQHQQQQQRLEQQKVQLQQQDQDLLRLKQELEGAHSRELCLQQQLAEATSRPAYGQRKHSSKPNQAGQHVTKATQTPQATASAVSPLQHQDHHHQQQQQQQQPSVHVPLAVAAQQPSSQPPETTQRLLMTAEGGALPAPTVHISVQELAQAHARAMSSELQLVMMEKDYAALKGEVASLTYGLHKEQGATQAAQDKAQAAVRQMQYMELQYQRQLESLESQLKAGRMQHWAKEEKFDSPHVQQRQQLDKQQLEPRPLAPLLQQPSVQSDQGVDRQEEQPALLHDSDSGLKPGMASDGQESTLDTSLLPEVCALFELRRTLLL